jgi:hypothetical protein
MARAADAPAGDDASGPYANEIRRLKERIHLRRESLQRIANDFQPNGDFIKGDLELLAAEYQTLTDACQRAIDAYRKGDAETGRALAKETEKTKESRDWRKRLDGRRQQAENWPSEKWAEEMQTRAGGARSRGFAPEWVQAKRRASAAWARYAESIAPGVEREKQIALEDAAYMAEAEVKAAEERWRVRHMIDVALWDKRVTSEELDRKVREFEALGDKASEVMKQRAESDQQYRVWQRERSRAEKELEETFRVVREQQEEARRKAKK